MHTPYDDERNTGRREPLQEAATREPDHDALVPMPTDEERAALADRDARAGHPGITKPTAAARRSPLFRSAQAALRDGSPNARLA